MSKSYNLSNSHSELSTVINSIYDETRKLLSLRRMSKTQRKLMSTDLALVGFAVRTGYLVDTVAPHNAVEVFSELLSRLRLTCLLFKSVMHVYEPASGQSFFVHVPLLLENGFPDILGSPSEEYNRRGKTIFVRIERDGFEIPTAPPSGLAAVLQSLLIPRSYLPTSITLPPDLTPEITVPLAALLLEYPVGYVPSLEQLPFPSNVPLDIYECILVFNGISVGNHLLLKFSCPSNLAEEHPDRLGSPHMVARLTTNFEGRLEESLPGATFHVTHSRDTKDRIAL